MRIAGKVVVVTGGASGIGKALCERFHRDGAKKVIVADLDEDGAQAVAAGIDGRFYRCDVSKEADIVRVIAETEERDGPIELFCSNAGISAGLDRLAENAGGAPDETWQRSWEIHVMAHIHAARALVPRMRARGGGYFLNTVSAAGLLSLVGNAVYATTKHAAIGFAENLAISHKAHNIRVSVLCPGAVDTPLLRAIPRGPEGVEGVQSADEVVDATVIGLEREQFLILPHPEISGFLQRKVENYDRWINGMAKLQAKLRDNPL